MKRIERAAYVRSSRWHQRKIELISIGLLSLAGVATSWSSYQAARWSGVQATEYSRANALRVESTGASATADQRRSFDIALFVAWIEAYATGDERVTEFYRDRFRDEFAPAFEAWLASRPMIDPTASASPFELSDYVLADTQRAAELDLAAENAFAAGQTASQRSDDYVFNAVLLASVLFFAGIVQQFRIPPAQYALLSIATVFLALGLVNIATLPKLS